MKLEGTIVLSLSIHLSGQFPDGNQLEMIDLIETKYSVSLFGWGRGDRSVTKVTVAKSRINSLKLDWMLKNIIMNTDFENNIYKYIHVHIFTCIAYETN